MLQIMDFEIVGNLEIGNKYDKGNVVKICLWKSYTEVHH
jgi:hypothetical protein